MNYIELNKTIAEWLKNIDFAATVEDHFNKRDKKPDWQEMTRKFNNGETRTDLKYIEALERINAGGTWIPTIFSQKKDSGFQKGFFFAVDFEENKNGVPHIEDELKKAERLHIPPLFYYETMNSTAEKPRFRFVWEVREPITASNEYKLLVSGLITAFGGDQACKSTVQFFAGGRNLHYAEKHFFTDIVNIKALQNNLTNTYINKTKRKISTAAADEKEYRERRYIEKVNWSVLENNCKLWRMVTSGEYWASYADIQHLALSAFSLKGGQKKIRETIKNNPQFYNNERHNIDYYLKAITNFKKKEHEERCNSNTCPFYKECRHIGFITDKVRQTYITRIEKEEKDRIDLSTAEEWLKKTLEATAASKMQYHFIKAPTGIGKTEQFKNLYNLFPLENITILQPTHKLKEETKDRFNTAGIHIEVQEEVILTPEEEKIGQAYYKAGLLPPKQKGEKQNKVFSNNEAMTLITQDRYLRHQEHFKNNIVICDEDILTKLLKIEKVNINTLIAALRNLMDNNIITKADYRKIEDYIDDVIKPSHKEGITIIEKGFPAITVNIDNYYEMASKDYKKLPDFNIFNLIKSQRMAFDGDILATCIKTPFPQAKKIIVLSATLDKEVYNFFYPELAAVWYECPPIKNKGKVMYDVTRTYSRNDLSRIADFGKLKETLQKEHKEFFSGEEELYLITYKKFAAKMSREMGIKTIDKISIGATEGKNELTGKKILIIGSNRLPDIDIAAYCVAMEKPPQDFRRVNLRLRRDEFEFSFFGFEDKQVERFYEWIIDTDTIQAIGRARILRFDTAVLLCGLPVDV